MAQRFLMLKPGENEEADELYTEIVIVQNWLEELKRLAPVQERQ